MDAWHAGNLPPGARRGAVTVGMKTMPAFDIEEVITTEALEKLHPEWSALWARCPAATPFQSPEWLIPWWRHIGEGQLWTLACRSEGRLVGLAPTDYLDALFAPGFASAGAAAVLAHLAAACERWDVCDLQQLRPTSP